MKKYILSMVLPFLVLGFISCDDGKIYDDAIIIPEEGRTLKMTGNISGVDKWPSDYSVVVAGFGESEYATISKVIPVPESDGGEVSVTMSGISDQVTRVELCVINQLRKRVATFYEVDCSTVTDTILMETGIIDAGMFNTIQRDVFNKTCTSCHGGSTFAAAGLYLIKGRSYNALVGKPSIVDENGTLLVKPYSTQESLLHMLLNNSLNSTLGSIHMNLITSSDLLTLIDNWIDNGAQQ